MTETHKISINPSVALTELNIDHKLSRDRRLFLADQLHASQLKIAELEDEISRLNGIISEVSTYGSAPIEAQEND